MIFIFFKDFNCLNYMPSYNSAGQFLSCKLKNIKKLLTFPLYLFISKSKIIKVKEYLAFPKGF